MPACYKCDKVFFSKDHTLYYCEICQKDKPRKITNKGSYNERFEISKEWRKNRFGKEPNKECVICNKKYWSARSDSKYCKRKCFDKGIKLRHEEKRKEIKEKKDWIKKVDNRGFYLKGINDYKHKIIDYADCPSGKVYIGINKEPLMPNDNGIGFKGVLLQDETRQFVQCSSCGEWKKKLTDPHLKKCSGLTVREYKEVFGLAFGQGLVSDETSLNLTRYGICSTSRNNNLNRIRKKSLTKENIRKSSENNRKTKQSMAWKNKHGTCPEQLKKRLKEFILCNRELPGSRNRGKILYKTLMRQFGTANNGLKHFGLPWRKRKGSSVQIVFPDYTVFKYNFNQWHDREHLFNLMKEKCPILKESKSET